MQQNKKAQSEMVGFALIVIIVAVLILVFLAIAMNKTKNEDTQSYEVESFISSSLEYTTNCTERSEFLPLRKVIFRCVDKQICQNGVDPCLEMNETWENLINNSWIASPEAPTKGYQFNITVEGKPFYEFHNGNKTIASKAAVQNFDSGVDIFFKVYV